jgi:uncharacterized membrane protein
MEPEVYNPKKWNWRKVFQYFLQGLIVLAPITITVWAVFSLFTYIDNILPNIFRSFLPLPLDAEGAPKKIPGLGFVLVVSLLVFVGWISSSYLFGKVVEFFGHALERTPGIRYIYTSVKDFLEAFTEIKRSLTNQCL